MSVTVTEDSLIDDVIKAAIITEKLETPPGVVTVKFQSVEVDTANSVKDELAKGHGNEKANHFVLKLLVEKGKKTLILSLYM